MSTGVCINSTDSIQLGLGPNGELEADLIVDPACNSIEVSGSGVRVVGAGVRFQNIIDGELIPIAATPDTASGNSFDRVFQNTSNCNAVVHLFGNANATFITPNPTAADINIDVGCRLEITDGVFIGANTINSYRCNEISPVATVGANQSMTFQGQLEAWFNLPAGETRNIISYTFTNNRDGVLSSPGASNTGYQFIGVGAAYYRVATVDFGVSVVPL